MADENPSPPSKREETPSTEQDLEAGDAAAQAQEIQDKADAIGLVDPDQLKELGDAIKHQSELRALLGEGSSLRLMQDIVGSPSFNLMRDLTTSPSMKLLGDSLERLTKLPRPTLPVIPDRVYNPVLPPSPDARTVSVLHEVHAELEGMASILNEGARQSQVMVEITTASLTALQAVISELKTSRESADRSNKALFWLTIALFVAAGVAAVAVIPEFVKELGAVWSWIQSLR